MPQTLERAKEIIEAAQKYGVFDWDDPNAITDELIVVKADEIVAQVLEHSKNNSVNEALLELLHVGQLEPLSDVTREAYVRKFGEEPAKQSSNGAVPAQPAASGFQQPTADDVAPDGTELGQPGGAREDSIDDIFGVPYDDLKVAQIKAAVLASAESGELSPEEWERIKAYEATHEERKSILGLQPEFKAPEPPSPVADVTQSVAPVFNEGGEFDGLEAVYAGQSQTIAQQERLPIPPTADGDQVPVLPIDITAVSDQELSRVATAFHSLFARAQWLISQEEGRERAAEHLEREAERDAFVRAYEHHKSSIPEDKQHQPTALEAARRAAERDAESADPVRKYRSLKVRHGIESRELKALSTGYDKAVWRVNEELQRRARLQVTRPTS